MLVKQECVYVCMHGNFFLIEIKIYNEINFSFLLFFFFFFNILGQPTTPFILSVLHPLHFKLSDSHISLVIYYSIYLSHLIFCISITFPFFNYYYHIFTNSDTARTHGALSLPALWKSNTNINGLGIILVKLK